MGENASSKGDIEIKITAGTRIEEVTWDAAIISIETGRSVRFDFNDQRITIDPNRAREIVTPDTIGSRQELIDAGVEKQIARIREEAEGKKAELSAVKDLLRGGEKPDGLNFISG